MMSGVEFQMGDFEFSIAMHSTKWINGSAATHTHTHTHTHIHIRIRSRIRICVKSSTMVCVKLFA